MSITTTINHVDKNLNTTHALNNITDIFEQGIVHGIIGPNGAGKTTLLRLITGLLKPTKGTITYTIGKDRLVSSKLKQFIAYFPQEPSLYPDLSCQEHLNFFRNLYNLDAVTFEKRSTQLLQATDMERFRDRPAGKLSGGMYKKLGLMCVLLNQPRLLLLDEPTIGVDPVSRQELWDIVYKVAGPEMTVILSTSYMDEAERCNKVHVLDNGQLLGSDTPINLMEKFKVKNFTEIFLNYAR